MTECVAFHVFLQRRRLELGLSHEQITKKLGLKDPGEICRAESGERSLPLDLIPDLADALRLDQTELCRTFLKKTATRFNKVLFAHDAKRSRTGRPPTGQQELRKPMFSEMMIAQSGESLLGEIV